MAQVTFKGDPVPIAGDLPSTGSKAPGFQLADTELQDRSLSDFAGKKVVLNIFPSLDTPVCADAMRAFNEKASGRDDTVVLCISKDTPFAQGRFCGAEGLESVVPLSAFRDSAFGRDYGIEMTDSPLRGLFARAVVVLDEDGNVNYTQLVPEIAEEPDYEAAMAAL